MKNLSSLQKEKMCKDLIKNDTTRNNTESYSQEDSGSNVRKPRHVRRVFF